MEKREAVLSVLKLERIIFDKIEFKRVGLSSEKELELEIQSTISQREGENSYRVTLELTGNKPEEYMLGISLTGFFTVDAKEGLAEKTKNTLITRNSVAILMPYLRSEVSLLTAQPGMECVVLPAFNINEMLRA